MTKIRGFLNEKLDEVSLSLVEAIESIFRTGRLPEEFEEKFYAMEGFNEITKILKDDRKNVESQLRAVSYKILKEFANHYYPKAIEEVKHKEIEEGVFCWEYQGKKNFPVKRIAYRAKQSLTLKLFRLYERGEDILDVAGIEIIFKTPQRKSRKKNKTADEINKIIENERDLCYKGVEILSKCNFLNPFPTARLYTLKNSWMEGLHQTVHSKEKGMITGKVYVDILYGNTYKAKETMLEEIIKKEGASIINIKGFDNAYKYISDSGPCIFAQKDDLMVELLGKTLFVKNRKRQTSVKKFADAVLPVILNKYEKKKKLLNQGLPRNFKIRRINKILDGFEADVIDLEPNGKESIIIYQYRNPHFASQHIQFEMYNHGNKMKEINVRKADKSYKIKRKKQTDYLIKQGSVVYRIIGTPRYNVQKYLLPIIKKCSEKVVNGPDMEVFRMSYIELPDGFYSLNVRKNYRFLNRHESISEIPVKKPLVEDRYTNPKIAKDGSTYKDLQTYMITADDKLIIEIQLKGEYTAQRNESGSLSHENYRKKQWEELFKRSEEAFQLVRAIDRGEVCKDKIFCVKTQMVDRGIKDLVNMLIQTEDEEEIITGVNLIEEQLSLLKESGITEKYYMHTIERLKKLPIKYILSDVSKNPIKLIPKAELLSTLLNAFDIKTPSKNYITYQAYVSFFERSREVMKSNNNHSYRSLFNIINSNIEQYASSYKKAIESKLPKKYIDEINKVAGGLAEDIIDATTEITENLSLDELLEIEDIYNATILPEFKAINEHFGVVGLPLIDIKEAEFKVFSGYHNKILLLCKDLLTTKKNGTEFFYDIGIGCYLLNELRKAEERHNLKGLTSTEDYWKFKEDNVVCSNNLWIPKELNRNKLRRYLKRVNENEFTKYIQERLNININTGRIIPYLKKVCNELYKK